MNRKSFTLIEVLLSVFLITVSVLGLYSGINYSYSSVTKASDKFVASYLAEEGVELVKNIRDSNFVNGNVSWVEGLTTCSDIILGCRMDYDESALTVNTLSTVRTPLWIDANGFYNYTESGTQTIFSRKIVVTIVSSAKIKISVTVYYGEEEFLLEQYLYDWK